jgi:hypothetical protein
MRPPARASRPLAPGDVAPALVGVVALAAVHALAVRVVEAPWLVAAASEVFTVALAVALSLRAATRSR